MASTPEAVLLAAWQVLLWKVGGRGELLIGVTATGRRFAELAGAVGLFARQLPLRCRLAPERPFGELAREVRAALDERQDWQDFFAWDEDAASAAEPWFAAGFEFAEAGGEIPCGAGLAGTIADRAACCDRFAVKLGCLLGPEGARLAWEYDPERLSRREVRRWAARLRALLAQAARAPQLRLGELAALGAEEWHRLLIEANDTRRDDLLGGGFVHDWVYAWARRTPGAVALAAGGETMSYAELDRRSGALAAQLRRRGSGPEVPVAICLERSPALVVAMLGVLRAGGAYLPIEPGTPRERQALLLAESGAPLVLTAERFLAGLAGTAAAPLCEASWETREVGEDDGGAASTLRADAAPAPALLPEHPAYLLYTSGSTGRPKAVVVPHRSLAASTRARLALYGDGPPAIALLLPGFAFDSSVAILFGTLCRGGTLVLPREGQQGEVTEIARLIEEHGVTDLLALPALHGLLLEQVEPRRLASLRRVIVAGEACPAGLPARHTAALPAAGLYNEYGPTETTVWASVARCRPEPGMAAVPIGRPIANARLYVLDAALQPVPAGTAGELSIGGAGVTRGYLGRPALTAERFLPDPFAGAAGARLYRSGDLVCHREDGALRFLGRADRQVKIRGFRVEPEEVAAVLGSHEAVREAVVAARADAAGGPRLVAYLVPRAAAAPPSSAALRAFLAERLPAYMLPAAFVTLKALPLTPNGKVDLRALPAPEPASGRGQGPAPRDAVEEALAVIWADVLGVPAVGVDDSFFELGGDSIRAIEVRYRAEQRGISFTMQQLFAQPTIARLARSRAGAGEAALAPPAPWSQLAPADRARLGEGATADCEDAYPLARLQLGMLFHSALAPSSAVYHDVTRLHLRAPLALDSLRLAFARLVARHPVLRTSFHLTGYAEPLQAVHREVRLPLTVVDLGALPAGQRRQVLAGWLAAERRRDFDWTAAPLLRAAIHRLGDGTFQWTLSFHHAVLDGWSAATLAAELFGDYVALARGESPPSAPPESAYAHFVALERQALAAPVSRAFWKAALAESAAAPLAGPEVGGAARPADPGDPVAPETDGASDRRPRQPTRPRRPRRVLPLPAELAAALRRLAGRASVPLKDVLLAAHLRVLALHTGRDDVTTGLVSHGRPEAAGGERALGLFLNTLPLRLRLVPESWLGLVERCFAAELAALPHRRFPLAEIQRLHAGRPLFDTLFNFVHFHILESVI
ncbi:MAG TPA: amino acid adenylation domain-containing protein, partial [Thermoanaerobaculia bacterium]